MKFYGLVMFSVTVLVVTILAFFFGGRYLDGKFNTGSRYLIVGAILGLTIGVVRMTLRLKGTMDGTGDGDGEA